MTFVRAEMPAMSPEQARIFRRKLLAWYRRQGRDLPWRRTRDPYAILLSEFMLQQTQVATVIPYYERWLQRFPDFSALATAVESDVLHAWQGLGYYARARNLHAAAKAVVAQHGNQFPREIADARELPGVGRYTAHAVATFAFDAAVPIVEANTARVFARLANLQLRVDSTAGQAFLWQSAESLLPSRNAGAHNSALLDLGALICVPGQPKCHLCPVQEFCRAQTPAELPRKRPRPALKQLTECHQFVQQRGSVLLEQSHDRWRGMWILPRLTRPPSAARVLHEAHFPFTHHRIKLAVFSGTATSPLVQSQRWFALPELASIPVPTPHRRALDALLV
ncbi:MAG: A/G-specific adenine glycosylase [Chthoniobacterales bacterium]